MPRLSKILATAAAVGAAAVASPAAAVEVFDCPASFDGPCNNFVSAALVPGGMDATATEILSNEVAIVGEGKADLTFTYIADTGSFQYCFGFCLAANVNPTLLAAIESGTPTDTQKRDFAKSCMLDNGNEIFADADTPGITTKLFEDVPAPNAIIFFLLPNDSIGTFAANPDGFWADPAKRNPLFSLSAANPGELDQLVLFTDGVKTLFGWEDKQRTGLDASDEDFSDLVFTLDQVLEADTPGGCNTGTFTYSPDSNSAHTVMGSGTDNTCACIEFSDF